MIIKLQNGDKLKIGSDEEARRKYKEHSLLSIGLKLKRNLNIASNFLKSGPNITNFGNAVSALFGGYSPENPDVIKGDPPGVGIKNFGNLVRTARVAREFNDVVKGPVNLFRLLNNFIEKFVTNPKGSGKLIHYDKGNGKSIYQENRGASIINNKLIPGKTKREGLKDYTWWNTDNPYMNVHKAKEGPFSPTRYIVVNDNTQFKHPFDLKEPVGQSAGKGKGFVVKTERVTDKPVDLTNAEIYEKSPFGWWERIKVLPTPKITKSKPYVRWSLKGYLNEAYNIEGGPGLKFLVVKDVDNPLPGILNTKGNGEYSLHFHSTRDNPNKEKMFQALAESIPEGGKVSTWGTISKGGYHGINRFGKLFGWPKVGKRPAVNGPVNIFLKPYTGNQYKREDVLIGDEWGADLYSYPEYVQYRINKIKKASPNIISKYNSEEFDHLYILDSDFTPMAKMNIGANMKGQLSEIVRRLNFLYKDVPLEVNATIKLLGDIPFVIGYFNNPGHTGMHNSKRNLSLVDPVPKTNLLSNIMHEHIMHGTDKWMTNSIAEKYLKFVDPIINNTNGTYKYNGWTYKIPEGTDTWYEGRATLGEIRKSVYDKLAKDKGIKISPETIELLRPEFEKTIDDLTIEEASELLTKTGGYGKVYGRLGPKNNPKFLLQFKYLMKVVPATIPFLIPRKEEKK